MLHYYRQSIINLLSEVHDARRKPFVKIDKWLNIQEKLIKKIIYAENKIRSLKNDIKQINFTRKIPNKRLTKGESLQMKAKIDQKKYQLDDYKRLIEIYKSIGDAIAFTFLHKLDIKPQNFKQPSGFISEKSGFKIEKQLLRYTFKKGGIAILNDLTSVLRYCDITLITPEGYSAIEVKSSETKNKRVERQKSNAEKVFKYLNEDITDGLYGINATMQRVSLMSPEQNHLSLINTLIAKSRKEGSVFHLAEPGSLFFVSHRDPSIIGDISEIFKQYNIIKPLAFMLNSMKFTEQGYYPFSLIFFKPDDYLDFLEGKFTVIIFIDTRIIKEIAERFKFSVHDSDDPNYAFEFKSKSKNQGINAFKMSKHYFHRTIMELVSLNWLMNDTFLRFTKI